MSTDTWECRGEKIKQTQAGVFLKKRNFFIKGRKEVTATEYLSSGHTVAWFTGTGLIYFFPTTV